jgi:hypothetical protein
MRITIFVVLAISLLMQCSDSEIVPQIDAIRQCATPATIRNFSGLDGCGYVLELSDGTILEPLQLAMCGPPPLSVMTIHDPLADFHYAGQQVLIDYENHDGVSPCMTGKLVKITCISKMNAQSIQEN